MSQSSDGTLAPLSQLASAELRTVAVSYLLEDAERAGLSLSAEVQELVKRHCVLLFDYKRDPAGAVAFSRSLKDIAVRLFRQRRYRGAVSRYELAAIFNPADPTLVSNRATCMYNMAKYRTCLNCCHDCITLFPTLFYENPMLYFKVLLRMGRANVELKNFTEAQATFDALSSMKNGVLNSSVGVPLPDGQLEKLLIPFEKHLKAKLEYENVTSVGSNAATPINAAPSEDAEEDSDCNEEDEEEVAGTIVLTDLCPHIYEFGEGDCSHSFPSKDHGARCNCPKHDGHFTDNSSYNSGNNSMPDLLSSSEEELSDASTAAAAASEDSNMPDLVSDDDDSACEDDHDFGNNDSGQDASMEEGKSRLSFLPLSPKRATASKAVLGRDGKSASRSSKARKTSAIDWRNAWKEPTYAPTSLAGSCSAAEAGDASTHDSPSQTAEAKVFKRGFLESKPLIVEDANEVAQFEGKRVSSSTRSKKWLSSCYESDQELGPVGSGLRSERLDEDEILSDYEKTMSCNPADANFDVGSCLREVLGKSFLTSRTIDFTRIFGHHQVANVGKKKKKSCDKNCGTCFARKMWKARFISADSDVAAAAIEGVDTDSRRDQQTFLTSELWQGTGYYASGYEMAYDVPALVHGVAYICHLQAEMYWRGNEITLVKDVQHSFISSLRSNYYKEHKNLHFLFMIFFMIRDTANLFGLFPDPQQKANSRSFQFSNSASVVGEKLMSTNGAGPSGGTSQALLVSKSDSLTQNMHNWSVLGQVAKEEEWVYNILLRDVSNLMMTITSTISKPPSYIEGTSFSEAFEKACGDRSNDDKYWKTRVVSIVARERSRRLERSAFEAKEEGELDKSALLYSIALQSRPQQARLYYRRAVIRFQQGKLREATNDIHKGITMAHEHPQAVHSARCDSPQKCLLQNLHVLQGDIHVENSKGEGDEAIACMKSAIGSYSKALNLNSNERIVVDRIREKLRLIKERYSKTQPGRTASSSSAGTSVPDSSKSVAGKQGKGKKERAGFSKQNVSTRVGTSVNKESGSRQLTGQANDSDETSSSDEEGVAAIGGNRYGALDGNAASTTSSKSKQRAAHGAEPSESGGGWETLARRAPRGKRAKSLRNSLSPQPLTGSRNTARVTARASAAGSSSTPANTVVSTNRVRDASGVSSPEYHCDLCDMRFGGKKDYSSHMRGRRHRTAFANARAASEANRRTDQARAVEEVEETARGPTQSEAATEAERAIAILGGEARPSDVVLRMNFLKWDIHDVNGYLEANFGGLLQLCNQHPQTFEVIQNARSRTMIVLVDRSGLASDRRRNARGGVSPAVQAFSRFFNNRASSSAPVASYGSRMADVTAMLNDVKLSAGTAEEVTGEYEEGLCGICFDDKEDVRIVPCKHKWCERCIMANVAKGRTVCPSCNGQVEYLERLAVDLD